MNRFKFLVSLITKDNDYQRLQATTAEEAARALDVDLEIVYADGEGLRQSQQLLEHIQNSSHCPNAIVVEPAGTGLGQVAMAAAAAGISWTLLNKDVDYMGALRSKYQVPLFAIGSDHEEVGRIQGRQFAALLPQGGAALYIQGPASSSAAEQRTKGMYETLPRNIQVWTLRGQWTEESAQKAIHSWLRLATSGGEQIRLVGCQNDMMAMGARKVLLEQESGKTWAQVPFTGCDGVPDTGQAWVRSKLLAATVIMPALTGTAMQMVMDSVKSGKVPPERTMVVPQSYPTIEDILTRRAGVSSPAGRDAAALDPAVP